MEDVSTLFLVRMFLSCLGCSLGHLLDFAWTRFLEAVGDLTRSYKPERKEEELFPACLMLDLLDLDGHSIRSNVAEER